MNNDLKIIKRNGEAVAFEPSKIYKAIEGALKDGDYEMSFKDGYYIAQQVVEKAKTMNPLNVEKVQDCVEKTLADNGFFKTAKAYIIYRQKHAEQREANQKLMESYTDLLFKPAEDMDLKRDNANINTNTPMGIMLKLGTEGAKSFLHNYALPEKFSRMHKDGYCHIHDADFSLITTNCVYIDLKKMLEGGFSTGHGYLREPNSIRSAAALACIIIQSSQNDCYGGQSFNAWDFGLAPYVKKSFKKAYRSNIEKLMSLFCDSQKALDELAAMDFAADYGICHSDKIEKQLSAWVKSHNIECNMSYRGIAATAWENAIEDTENETKQAMEAAIHNFNSLHSRAGSQTPFSSLNFGMDISLEGRLVTRMTLEAQYEGLGHGETPIFPITVFQLKVGVNYNEGDPNYDLFKLACKVSAKRLFPNFLSLDAPFNLKYYKEGNYNTYAAAMGCRTRTMSNVNGPEETGGRGNFAFTTINLPMLALDAKAKYPNDKEKMMEYFWTTYDKYIDMSRDYLQQRYEIIASKKVYNFPFLMGQGEYMGSENLKPDDEIREALKHASISIGFCGLAECLKALTGTHHGESEDAQKLGLKIVGHLRSRTDEFTEKYHMNWSTFGTPAESTAGEFLRACRRKYGVIKGITEHNYFTNSSHVPVYYPIRAIDKIRIEAPYHALENAGCITYIEMDGDPTKNLKAFEILVRAMHDANMHYFAINHPVDRDPVCGYTGIIENVCPHCHRKEMKTSNIIVPRFHKD